MDIGLQKSAFRILILFNLRVSKIDYYLVCSLPIHTRSSANAEGPRAHCQLKDSISHSGDISGGVKSCNVSSGPGHAHLGDSLSSKGYYFSEPNGAKKLRRHVTVTTPTWG